MKQLYIYLVFSRTGTWLSECIGYTTNSPYTHVALSLDSSFNNMYTFGRLAPNTPFTGGLTVENLHEGVYKNDHCKSLIYKIPVTYKQLCLLQNELCSYYSSDTEYKYNFLGLFAVLFGISWKRSNYYFCSQFITELFEKSEIWTSPKKAELTRPTDLMSITNKEIIFEGLLCDFINNSKDIAILTL